MTRVRSFLCSASLCLTDVSLIPQKTTSLVALTPFSGSDKPSQGASTLSPPGSSSGTRSSPLAQIPPSSPSPPPLFQMPTPTLRAA